MRYIVQTWPAFMDDRLTVAPLMGLVGIFLMATLAAKYEITAKAWRRRALLLADRGDGEIYYE